MSQADSGGYFETEDIFQTVVINHLECQIKSPESVLKALHPYQNMQGNMKENIDK
jgi:hypothetical protein